jgi:hypothetical protein
MSKIKKNMIMNPKKSRTTNIKEDQDNYVGRKKTRNTIREP